MTHASQTPTSKQAARIARWVRALESAKTEQDFQRILALLRTECERVEKWLGTQMRRRGRN